MSNATTNRLRKQLLLLMVGLIFLLGIISLSSIPLLVFPDVKKPIYQVEIAAQGLSSDEVEAQISQPVEGKIRELSGIKKLTATSGTGQAKMEIETENNFGNDFEDKLQAKLQDIEGMIGSRDSIKITQEELYREPIATVFMTGLAIPELKRLAEKEVKGRFERMDGISQVIVKSPDVQNQIELLLRPAMLRAYQITPGDIVSQLQNRGKTESLGGIGQGVEQTSFYWSDASNTLEDLYKLSISTPKGGVALHQLVDIRDSRQEIGDSLTLYHGEPVVEYQLFAAKEASLLTIDQQLRKQIVDLNREANKQYQVFIRPGALQESLASMRMIFSLFSAVSILAATYIAYRMRQWKAGFFALGSILLTLFVLVTGLYFTNQTLTIASVGPLLVLVTLCIGAGMLLFERYALIETWNYQHVWQATKSRWIPVVLPLIIVSLLFIPLLYSRLLKEEDKLSLLPALPILFWGLIGACLIYLYVLPTATALWLQARKVYDSSEQHSTQENSVRYTNRIDHSTYNRIRHWTNQKMQATWYGRMQLGMLPYVLALLVAWGVYFFCGPFAQADPFLKWNQNESKTLSDTSQTFSLDLPPNTTMVTAIQKAKDTEITLHKTIPELFDSYMAVTPSSITFYLQYQNQSSWERSSYKIKQAIDKVLGNVADANYSAKFDQTGSENEEKVKFTVQGPSLPKVKEVANQVMQVLEKTGEGSSSQLYHIATSENSEGQQMEIVPKAEISSLYGASIEDVKRQINSYLGPQMVSTVEWNDVKSQIILRYPKLYMDYPDQLQQALIHTPKGMRLLGDLVTVNHKSLSPTYIRTDKVYQINVHAYIKKQDEGRFPTTARSLYYSMPENFKKEIMLPTDYKILTPLDKELEEHSVKGWEQKGPFVITFTLSILIALIVAVVLRQLRSIIIVILLIPLLLVPLVAGIAIWDLPVNQPAVFATLLLFTFVTQQTLVMCHYFEEYPEQGELSLIQSHRGKTATFMYMPSLLCAVVIFFIPFLPFLFGWTNRQFFSSFLGVMSLGFLCFPWIMFYVVPSLYRQGNYHPSEHRAHKGVLLKQLVANWWNNRGRRFLTKTDKHPRSLEWSDNRVKMENDSTADSDGRPNSLRPEDFQPVPRTDR
ncbi:efflux RND transporter permease subunit [Brevibacterium sp. JNUCC-42]|nr:efflux RND transporter permease subunit [Brevibacterium sp. JNUCC-42]